MTYYIESDNVAELSRFAYSAHEKMAQNGIPCDSKQHAIRLKSAAPAHLHVQIRQH